MIYFVACPQANAVKIGAMWGGNPYHRLMTLQVGCPFDLELLAVCDGGDKAEAALHDRFAEHRIRGEWFRLTDELRAHIAQFSKPERLPRGWHSQKRNRKALAA